MSKPYDDLDEALYNAALAARAKYNNEKEAITLVYDKDGKFYFPDPYSTAPETGHTKGEFALPAGAHVRGLAHNHPEGDKNELFSNDDINQATNLNVPSVIVFGDDKSEPTIRSFTPNKTSTQRYGAGAYRRFNSKGDAFNYIAPVQVTQQQVPTTAQLAAMLLKNDGGPQ